MIVDTSMLCVADSFSSPTLLQMRNDFRHVCLTSVRGKSYEIVASIHLMY